MKKRYLALLTALVFALSGAVYFYLYRPTQMKMEFHADNSYMELLTRQINENLPERVDEFTTLDSIKLQGHKTIVQYYTLTLPENAEETSDSLKEIIAGNLLETVSTSADTSNLRHEDYTFIFIYLTPDGDVFTEVSITPEMYK